MVMVILHFAPSIIGVLVNMQKGAPFLLIFLQLFPKIQIWQSLYALGVVFPKCQHGEYDFSIWASPKMRWCTLHSDPCCLDFAHYVSQNSKGSCPFDRASPFPCHLEFLHP